MKPPRFELRRAGTRGSLRNAWLDARFSFSFADWDDPRRRRFGPLLTLNDDRVQPGGGFPMHGHRDLEIVMLPLQGAIEHRDSRGGHGVLRPGAFQWVRAGHGIRHSQFNPSDDTVDHHLQIWFEPSTTGLEPLVVQAGHEPLADGAWRTLVHPQAEAGALDIGVDVVLALGRAAPRAPLLRTGAARRGLYLHVIDAAITLQAEGESPARLEPGDAAVFFDGAPALALHATQPARVLAIETAAVDALTGRVAETDA